MSHHWEGEHMASMRQNPMYIWQTRDRSDARRKYSQRWLNTFEIQTPKWELQILSEMHNLSKILPSFTGTTAEEHKVMAARKATKTADSIFARVVLQWSELKCFRATEINITHSTRCTCLLCKRSNKMSHKCHVLTALVMPSRCILKSTGIACHVSRRVYENR